MKHICIWLIRVYQRWISPLKRRPTCRFTPSCSAYALQALEERGFFVGGLLSAARILRCQPLCPGGYDPVPARGEPLSRKKRLAAALQDNEKDGQASPKIICEDYVTRRERRGQGEDGRP